MHCQRLPTPSVPDRPGSVLRQSIWQNSVDFADLINFAACNADPTSRTALTAGSESCAPVAWQPTAAFRGAACSRAENWVGSLKTSCFTGDKTERKSNSDETLA